MRQIIVRVTDTCSAACFLTISKDGYYICPFRPGKTNKRGLKPTKECRESEIIS